MVIEVCQGSSKKLLGMDSIFIIFLDRINRIIRNFSPAARASRPKAGIILTILLILSKLFSSKKRIHSSLFNL